MFDSKYKPTNILLSLALVVLGVIMVIPMFWMIATSFKTRSQIWQPSWIPDPFTLENYEQVLDQIPIVRMLLNSIMVSVISTIGQLFIGTLAAYAFARIRFKGSNIVFMIFLGTMMIPSYVLITPLYLIINRLGILNTYAALIMPKLVSVFAIFMLRQFFLSMPRELDESAFIDGANRFRVLFQIISPNCKPAYASLFIFSFMGVWNDFMWPLIVTNSEAMRTIQVGVAYFRDSNVTRYGPTMAASFLASIPILIVFLIANKSFVAGITMTGIKG
ncbi:MAG: carbohydrate ABC transporter permease [Treponema sp.]|jgi:multiple sugar transport system permease protein|nr:carbohydrate ABC transporter permease [Treponema sp.]